MDMNGKADPYIEVSLRPGQKKFTTSIKTYSLNPTFNETEEFPVTPNDIANGDLVLKVMDSDFPMADELIGIIRLPLRSLDLSINSKPHSCLLSHDKVRNRHELTALDAAKLNLKISQNEQQLEALRKDINETSIQLQLARDNTIEMRNHFVGLTIEKNFLETKFDVYENDEWSDPETGEQVAIRRRNGNGIRRQRSRSYSYLPGRGCSETQSLHNTQNLEFQSSTESTPSPLSISPEVSSYSSSKIITGTAHELCLQNLHSLRQRIAFEDQKISQLRNYIQVLEPTKLQCRKGAIEVGLSFSHIASRLKISILSASKLHVLNASGHAIERRPNPYVKIKIFQRNAPAYPNINSAGAVDKLSKRRASSGKRESVGKSKNNYRWTFKTQIALDTITPAWNEHYEVDDITEEDLPNMYIEITVMDYNKFSPNKALGQIRIGPGNMNDNQHWEEMLTHHGAHITMTHFLEDI